VPSFASNPGRLIATVTLFVASAMTIGCGAKERPQPPAAASESTAGGEVATDASAPREQSSSERSGRDRALEGEIRRAELDPILEAGLGRFLQGVESEPYVREGDFVGFRVLALWPDDPRFRNAGIEPGDVVTSVNGHPIERPAQALKAWQSLRVASELMVEILRDGERRTLRFAIVDDG
jgi:general secretion pathway protein C